jgi:hypothetical protein
LEQVGVTDDNQQKVERAGRRTPDRTEYQRQYYLSRREELAEAKRRRYQEDPAYRLAVQQATVASKERARRNRGLSIHDIQRLASDITQGAMVMGPQGPVRVYMLKAMAQALGMSYLGMLWWRKKGILPPSPYRLNEGIEMYSQAQIAVVSAAREHHLAQYPSTLNRILMGGC